MGKLLWSPSEARINSSNLYRFIAFVNDRYGGEDGNRKIPQREGMRAKTPRKFPLHDGMVPERNKPPHPGGTGAFNRLEMSAAARPTCSMSTGRFFSSKWAA